MNCSLSWKLTSTELISYVCPSVKSMSRACMQASATTILLASPMSLSPKIHERKKKLWHNFDLNLIMLTNKYRNENIMIGNGNMLMAMGRCIKNVYVCTISYQTTRFKTFFSLLQAISKEKYRTEAMDNETTIYKVAIQHLSFL